MRTAAALKVSLTEADARRSLLSVLAPDNAELPKGLRLSAVAERNAVGFLVEASSPSTAISTVLALLRDIALFQEVWLLSRGEDARVRRARA